MLNRSRVKEFLLRTNPLTPRKRVEDVVEQLAWRIISGRLAPGDLLPSVRAIAQEFDINPSTAQIVLGQLSALGFVETRPGIGAVVRDIRLYGGMSTWRYLFRFAHEVPDLAADVLADLLELRLMLVFHTLERIAAAPDRANPGDARAAFARMRALAQQGRCELQAFAEAELEVARRCVFAVGQTAIIGTFNSLTDALWDTPLVIDAMYPNPSANIAVWDWVLDRWEQRTLCLRDVPRLRSLVKGFDRATIWRFRTLLLPGTAEASSAERATG
ncbi:MAG: GntR family transcriptional regulator [Candidatus Dadabacteria bacterium]|nr:MAG: GntR family transcriptional regulator [Candidatus Dadabacteria bacterium]